MSGSQKRQHEPSETNHLSKIPRKDVTKEEVGILFTKDKIPINTICFDEIPLKVPKKEITGYFNQWGKVSSLSFSNGSRDRGCRHGFATFEDAISASKVLNHKFHFICQSLIKIEPANSWDQPAYAKVENSILRLNDDCLMIIFSFLKIWNLLNLSLLCERFSEVINQIFWRYKTINLEDLRYCKKTQCKYFFNTVGQTLKSVTYCGAHVNDDVIKSFLTLASRKCSGVTCLELIHLDLNTRFYKEFNSIFPNLTSLTLKCVNMTDRHCLALENCVKLQYLDLSYNAKISGNYLHSLPNLKNLNFWGCDNVQPLPFMELCKVSKLTELNIGRCPQLNMNQAVLDFLLQTQNDLEVLCISNSYKVQNLNVIVKLQKLRHLEIWSTVEISNDFFSELVKYKKNDLQVLSLPEIKLNQNQQENILLLTGLKELEIIEDAELVTAVSNGTCKLIISCVRVLNEPPRYHFLYYCQRQISRYDEFAVSKQNSIHFEFND